MCLCLSAGSSLDARRRAKSATRVSKYETNVRPELGGQIGQRGEAGVQYRIPYVLDVTQFTFFSLTVVISYVLTRTINSCDHPDILPRNEIKTKT